MSHVPPHRWADAFAGNVEEAERAEMERHADSCRACSRKRDRVRRASQSFPVLRAQSTPELPWDSVRARVHWSVSSERRREKPRGGRRGFAIVALGTLAAGGAALALALASGSKSSTPKAAAIEHEPAPSPLAPKHSEIAGVVSRVAGQVMIDGVRRSDAFERTLGAGTVFATGDGRIDVQFGDHSAFALGKRSTLELRRFDDQRIELVVEGTVDIELSARGPRQTFFVLAGDRTVEVRGTQFRVIHDAKGTRVACRHGLVTVRDPHGELSVAAARKVEVAGDAAVHTARVTPLSVDELDELAQATPTMVPLWSDAATIVKSSSALEVATVGKRAVRVDGVEVGDGPLRVRVMPGRHTVETADSAGRFRRAGWVDVTAEKPARLEVHAEAPPTGGAAARRKQLHAGIDRTRLAHCTRAFAKQGFTDTYVRIEISIDESGAVGYLNVIDSDLPATTQSCVREVLSDVRFRSGAAATFRDKIDL